MATKPTQDNASYTIPTTSVFGRLFSSPESEESVRPLDLVGRKSGLDEEDDLEDDDDLIEDEDDDVDDLEDDDEDDDLDDEDDELEDDGDEEDEDEDEEDDEVKPLKVK